jgi:hypothetical protein
MAEVFQVDSSSFMDVAISSSLRVTSSIADFSQAIYVTGSFSGSFSGSHSGPGQGLTQVSASFIIPGSNTSASFATTSISSSIALNVVNYPPITVYNSSSGPLPVGTPVYLSSSLAGFPLAWPAIADGTNTQFNVAGVTNVTINAGATGSIVNGGLVTANLNFPTGSQLWLSSTVSGTFQTTIPSTGTLEKVSVGYCILSGSSGTILVLINENAYGSITSSYAGTASILLGSITSASYALTSSFALTANATIPSQLSVTGITASAAIRIGLLGHNARLHISASDTGNVPLLEVDSLILDKVFIIDSTGSIIATGSLQGSASYALTSSFAITSSNSNTASFLVGSVTSASYAGTASVLLGSISSATQAAFATQSLFATQSTNATRSLTSSVVNVTASNTNTDFYVTFAANSGSQTLFIDTSSFVCNPSSNLITIQASGSTNGGLTVTGILNNGYITSGSASFSHAEGLGTYIATSSDYSHAEGFIGYIATRSLYSHVEGYQCFVSIQAGNHNISAAHAEGEQTSASAEGAHSEGFNTNAHGIISHAEGDSTVTTGLGSHAEGLNGQSQGDYSHVEGNGCQVLSSTTYGHAEGILTTAQGGDGAHAEGFHSLASGKWAHAEGEWTLVQAQAGRAAGSFCTASGYASYAAGSGSLASGDFSFAHGIGLTVGNLGNPSASAGSASFAFGRRLIITAIGSFGIGLDDTARTLAQNNSMVIVGGNVGIGTLVPSVPLQVQGIISSSAITSSLFGTASWANNVLTASFLNGNVSSASYANTSSWAINSTSASYLSGTFSITNGQKLSPFSNFNLGTGSGIFDYYPNVAAYEGTGNVSGSILITTPITRTSANEFIIHVRGSASGSGQSLINFIVSGQLTGSTSALDNQSGSLINLTLMDLGHDTPGVINLPKRIGITSGSAGVIAIALGDTASINFDFEIGVDYRSLVAPSPNGFGTWNITNVTTSNYGMTGSYLLQTAAVPSASVAISSSYSLSSSFSVTSISSSFSTTAATGSTATSASYASSASVAANFTANNQFSRGGTIFNSSFIPNAAQNIFVWRAPFTCTASAFNTIAVGVGASSTASVNARKNGVGTLLSASFAISGSGAYSNLTVLQSQSFAAGDRLEIMLVGTTGSISQVNIQIDFNR